MSKRKKNESGPEPLLTCEQLSQIIGITEPMLGKLRREAGFPHYKIGSMVRFRLSEVEEWLKQRKVS